MIEKLVFFYGISPRFFFFFPDVSLLSRPAYYTCAYVENIYTHMDRDISLYVSV